MHGFLDSQLFSIEKPYKSWVMSYSGFHSSWIISVATPSTYTNGRCGHRMGNGDPTGVKSTIISMVISATFSMHVDQ